MKDSELLLLRNFYNLEKKTNKSPADYTEITQFIENIIRSRQALDFVNYDKMIALSFDNPRLAHHCQHPELADCWLDLWNSRPKTEFGYELKSQPGFTNFNLVRSERLYTLATENNDITLLLKAVEFKSFSAIKDYLFILFEMLKEEVSNRQESRADMFKKLGDLQKHLIFHGTPGCMLISGAYLILSNFYDGVSEKVEASILYKLAYTHRYAGYLLQPHSAAAIHNATKGLGIEQLSQKRTSNLEKLCEDLARTLDLKPDDIITARREAEKIAQEYLAIITNEEAQTLTCNNSLCM